MGAERPAADEVPDIRLHEAPSRPLEAQRLQHEMNLASQAGLLPVAFGSEPVALRLKNLAGQPGQRLQPVRGVETGREGCRVRLRQQVLNGQVQPGLVDHGLPLDWIRIDAAEIEALRPIFDERRDALAPFQGAGDLIYSLRQIAHSYVQDFPAVIDSRLGSITVRYRYPLHFPADHQAANTARFLHRSRDRLELAEIDGSVLGHLVEAHRPIRAVDHRLQHVADRLLTGCVAPVAGERGDSGASPAGAAGNFRAPVRRLVVVHVVLVQRRKRDFGPVLRRQQNQRRAGRLCRLERGDVHFRRAKGLGPDYAGNIARIVHDGLLRRHRNLIVNHHTTPVDLDIGREMPAIVQCLNDLPALLLRFCESGRPIQRL